MGAIQYLFHLPLSSDIIVAVKVCTLIRSHHKALMFCAIISCHILICACDDSVIIYKIFAMAIKYNMRVVVDKPESLCRVSLIVTWFLVSFNIFFHSFSYQNLLIYLLSWSYTVAINQGCS